MKKGWMILLLGTAGACCICCTGIGFFIRNWQVGQNEAIQDYKAAGLPWTVEDLKVSHPVPEEDNAAATALKLVAAFENRPYSTDRKDLVNSIIQNDSRSAQKILAQYKEPLDLARAISQKPKLNFNRDWNQGGLIKTPEPAKVRDGAHLLAQSAQYHQLVGNDAQAIADLEAASRLANLINQEPTIINTLMSVTARKHVLSAYEQVANTRDKQRKPIQPLIKSLQDSKFEIDFAEIIKTDAYIALATLRNFHQLGSLTDGLEAINSGEGTVDSFTNPAKDGMPKREPDKTILTTILRFWADNYPLIENPDFSLVKFTQDLDDQIEDMGENGSIIQSAATVFLPTYQRFGQIVSDIPVQHQVTLAYLHAIDYKRTHRKMPSSVKDMTGDFTDPYTGEPLRITTVSGQWRIYSLGADNVNQGALSRQEWKAQNQPGAETDDVFSPIPVNP